MNRKHLMPEKRYSLPPVSTEDDVLATETESWLSAFIDGEANLSDPEMTNDAVTVRRLYAYQLIRASIRGQSMTSHAGETVVWHERRCLQLWQQIDQHGQDD
jgi:hypothetical protein